MGHDKFLKKYSPCSYSPLDNILHIVLRYGVMDKRMWKAHCPFCGRAYGRRVWDLILGVRHKGVLGCGIPVPRPGSPRYGKADVTVTSAAELDDVLGVGLFAGFKARLLDTVFNWLGNGWLSRGDLRDLLNRLGKFCMGYPVASFGPGYAQGGCRRDLAKFSWGAEALDAVSRDRSKKVWG